MSSSISSSEGVELKRFARRAALFLLPVVLLPAAALYVFPLEVFYHRPWEALRVSSQNAGLPGPFYPGRRVRMEEQGGLGYYTRYAVTNTNVWVTDRYGQRTRDREVERYDVVIAGDSFVVCPGVDQRNILSEQLEGRLGRTVYPYYGGFNRMWAEPRFASRLPAVVAVVAEERNIAAGPALDLAAIKPRPGGSAGLWGWRVEADRWRKLDLVPGVKAWVRRWVGRNIFGDEIGLPSYAVVGKDGRMLFLKSEPRAADDAVRAAGRLETLSRELRVRGVRLIMVAVPEKQTIYADNYPGYRDQGFLAGLMAELDRRGVEHIDLFMAYREARARGVDPYILDDTHWNAAGIEIAARLLAERIEAGPPER